MSRQGKQHMKIDISDTLHDTQPILAFSCNNQKKPRISMPGKYFVLNFHSASPRSSHSSKRHPMGWNSRYEDQPFASQFDPKKVIMEK